MFICSASRRNPPNEYHSRQLIDILVLSMILRSDANLSYAWTQTLQSTQSHRRSLSHRHTPTSERSLYLKWQIRSFCLKPGEQPWEWQFCRQHEFLRLIEAWTLLETTFTILFYMSAAFFSRFRFGVIWFSVYCRVASIIGRSCQPCTSSSISVSVFAHGVECCCFFRFVGFCRRLFRSLCIAALLYRFNSFRIAQKIALFLHHFMYMRLMSVEKHFGVQKHFPIFVCGAAKLHFWQPNATFHAICFRFLSYFF